MARPTLSVTYTEPDTARLPDRFTEGVAILYALHQRGFLDEVGERLLIRRQGGYCGLDAFLFLLLYFSAGANTAVSAIDKKLRPHNHDIAALFGRASLTSSSSVGRALKRVEVNLLRPIAPWLLAGVAQIDELLTHPTAQSYDANGQPWHLFDLDPTVTTIRQRALPVADDLPEPMRRADDTGAPGHMGPFGALSAETSCSGASPSSTPAALPGYTPTSLPETATASPTSNPRWTAS